MNRKWILLFSIGALAAQITQGALGGGTTVDLFTERLDSGGEALVQSSNVTLTGNSVGPIADGFFDLVVQIADLQITKTGPTNAVAGTTITYSLTVTNQGSMPATGLMVTDLLPAGVTPGGTVVTNLGDLAIGASTSIQLQVTIDADLLGSLTNLAFASSDLTDPDTSDNTNTWVSLVTAEADLDITKTAPAAAVAGTSFDYSITVSNAGPSTATNVVVVDTLPPGASTSDPLTYSLGSLVPGASTSLTLSVDIGAGVLGPITNRATVSSGTPDPASGNNSNTATTVIGAEAELAILQMDSPDPVVAGETLVYSITVTNAGPSDATDVQVSDTLPGGVTPSGVVMSNLGTVAANASTTFPIQVTVDSDTLGVITNTATVTSSATDTNSANDGMIETTTVTAEADLGILQVDSPDPVIAGETLIYTITVTNAGPSDATGVQVSDTLPSGLTPSGGVISNLGTVAANATTTFPIQVTVDSDTLGVLTNAATVTSTTTDTNSANDAASEATTVNAEADLGITKSAPTNGIAGATLTYTIIVTNNGPSDATNVQATDTLPGGVTPSGVVISNLGTMAANAFTTFSIQVTIDDDTEGVLTNSITVISPVTDTSASNDMGIATTTVSSEADLSVMKTASTNEILAGFGFDWFVTVSNAGPSVAQNTEVVDILPAGVSPTGPQTNALGTLAVGATTTLTYSVTVDEFTHDDVVNTVSVASDAEDNSIGNNQASNAVGVTARTTWVDRDGDGNLVITDIAVGSKEDDLVLILDTNTSEIVITDTGALFVATIGTTDVTFTEARVALADLTGSNIQVAAAGSNDQVTVDYSNGVFGVNLQVDGGDDADGLWVAGGSGADTFSLSGASVRSQMLDVDFTNVEDVAVAGRGGDDLYLFQPDWGVKEILEDPAGGTDTLDFSAVSNGLIATINSIEITDGVNTALHADAEIEVLITGSGSDLITVEGYGNVLAIDSGPGGDQVTVGTGSLDWVTMDLTLDGGASLDLLTVDDGDDADTNSVTLTDGVIDRTPAASLIYTNFELLTVNLNNDQLSGTVGDGPGSLLLMTVNLDGDTEVVGTLTVDGEGSVIVGAGGSFSGAGSIENFGAIRVPTNDIGIAGNLTLAAGGLLKVTSGGPLSLTSGGDFSFTSGNPNTDFLGGGVSFTGGGAHLLTADAADRGDSLAGYRAGNRAIGTLDLQDSATVNGTVYVWEITGSGDLTIPSGSTVYYASQANWSGSVLGGGEFIRVFIGFDSVGYNAGDQTVGWPSQPGFTSEIYVTDDLDTGTYSVVTGFVGTATSESYTESSSDTNRYYQLRLRP